MEYEKLLKLYQYFFKGEMDKLLEEATKEELKELITIISCSLNKEKINKLLELIDKSKLNWEYVNEILWQIRYIVFSDYSMKTNYIEEKRLVDIINNKFISQHKFELSYIPYEKRTKDVVLITVDQFLSNSHAPTQMVNDIMITLGKLNMKVYLLVNTYVWKDEDLVNIWADPIKKNIIYELYQENLTVEDIIKNRFVQIDYLVDTENKIKMVDNFINEIKPEFIWHLGGIDIVSEIIGKKSTFISTKFTDGYSASNADILASYMASNSDYNKEALDTINRLNQKIYHFKVPGNHMFEAVKIHYQRKDFGMPENKFLLVLVGNRLRSEINIETKKFLINLIESSDNFCLVTIGEQIEIEMDKDKIIQLGYQRNLTDVLALCNVFINPPRQGGGGGAFAALEAGIPVLTMPNCDVGNTVPDAFILANLEKIKEEIIKCYRDEQYYEHLKLKAKEYYCRVRDRVTQGVGIESIDNLFVNARTWVEKKEIK